MRGIKELLVRRGVFFHISTQQVSGALQQLGLAVKHLLTYPVSTNPTVKRGFVDEVKLQHPFMRRSASNNSSQRQAGIDQNPARIRWQRKRTLHPFDLFRRAAFCQQRQIGPLPRGGVALRKELQVEISQVFARLFLVVALDTAKEHRAGRGLPVLRLNPLAAFALLNPPAVITSGSLL